MSDIMIIKTNIEGLYIIEPKVFIDDRGSLIEAYNSQVFASHVLNAVFVQDNEVFSKENVLRGMHVNVRHPQGKLVRVIDGEILDVVIDLRKNSSTYMTCFSIILSEENKKQLYIPPGIGHGYLAIKDSRVIFKTTSHYLPNDEISFAWNSRAISIDWRKENPILNERDMNSKDLYEVWI